MNKITAYCKDSYRELVEKVTWPTWTQLQQSTTIVLAASALITILVWVMDAAISKILQFFYSII
jgi:preprotein translocase subunit SecE